MNKKVQLYESIMRNVAKEVKKALNEAAGTLNNAEAYRFLSIYVVKAIKDTLGDKAEKTENTRGLTMKLQVGGRKKEAHVSMCYKDRNEVAVSQSKMMYMKNIVFIAEGCIYIVSGDLLRENWSNSSVCRFDKNQYSDAIGESSIMTRFNLDFLKANASDIIPMPSDIAKTYNDNYENMSVK